MLLRESYFSFVSYAFALFWSTAAQFFIALYQVIRKRSLGKTAKTRYKDYLPWAIHAKAPELSGL